MYLEYETSILTAWFLALQQKDNLGDCRTFMGFRCLRCRISISWGVVLCELAAQVIPAVLYYFHFFFFSLVCHVELFWKNKREFICLILCSGQRVIIQDKDNNEDEPVENVVTIQVAYYLPGSVSQFQTFRFSFLSSSLILSIVSRRESKYRK